MTPSTATIGRRHAYTSHAYTYYPVLVIGAGESGIAMGCKLKQDLGFDQFRLFDRQSGVGGTWWINRYPGVACDIPALLYSFSFAKKNNWSRQYPPGPEIHQYLVDVCEKFQIFDKIQLNTDVKELKWIEDAEEWQVTLTHLVPGTGDWSQHERDRKIAVEGEQSVNVATEVVRAKIVVSGVGSLVEPNKWPKDVPGVEEFEGDMIHTARWKDNLDPQGKDVVVVGSGCSAAQVVSALASSSSLSSSQSPSQTKAKSVTQVMRTPPWILPDPIPYEHLPAYEKYMAMMLRNVPGFGQASRAIIFCVLELAYLQVFTNTDFARQRRPKLEQHYLENMRAIVPAKYHDMLTPKYSLGCKRRIINNDWYRSLQAPNVELTTSPLTSVQARSVTLGREKDAKQVPADAIILANGYQTNEFLHPLKVIGGNGKHLNDLWNERGGAQAYLGIAMDQFPNFFMVFGPNTGTGHNSVIFASENSVNYTLRLIQPILDGLVSTYEITEEAERNWTRKLQDALQGTVFKQGGCVSWYQTESGWNSTMYPFSQVDYYLRCTFPVWRHWKATYTQKGLRAQRIQSTLKRLLVIAALTGMAALVQMKGTTRQLYAESAKGMVAVARQWLGSVVAGH